MRPGGQSKIKPSALVVPGLLLLVLVGIVLFVALRPKPQEAAPSFPGVTVLLPDDELSTVEWHDGVVWCGGREGLYRVDPQTLAAETITLPAEMPKFQYVRGLLSHRDALWVAYDGGVAKLWQGEWQVAGQGFPDLRMTSLCVAPNGSDVWAGSYGGAVLLSPELQLQKTLLQQDGLLSSMVNTITVDEAGNVWFGSYLERPGAGGVSILHPDGSFQRITDEEGLPHHDITSFLPQGEDMLVGCGMLNRGGAARLAPDERGQYHVVQTWSIEDGLASEKVRSLFAYGQQIWFCSETSGIAVYQDGAFLATLTKAQGLSDDEIKDIAQDPQGTLYLASRYGLTCITPQGVAHMLASH